ncbi:Sperm motility kinase 2B [Symbiodinium microadriaticum]|uniref:mitogen-activated protein kinase kinase n=1 Tax=Symbiodinium microadriaticum TaxID=2951 RepID=A0A1Q9D319_SYMMI|nr:Sperm motility kinase 2B [Symbiodinium microadriaticum]
MLGSHLALQTESREWACQPVGFCCQRLSEHASPDVLEKSIYTLAMCFCSGQGKLAIERRAGFLKLLWLGALAGFLELLILSKQNLGTWYANWRQAATASREVVLGTRSNGVSYFQKTRMWRNSEFATGRSCPMGCGASQRSYQIVKEPPPSEETLVQSQRDKAGGEGTWHEDFSTRAVGAVGRGASAPRTEQPPASRHAGVPGTGDQRNRPPIASPQRYKETAVLPCARRLDLTEFEMLDLIDETPMSAVYRLRHRRTGITVAGKRIQKGCDVHRSGDYLNEVQMLHSLAKSPYIVSLHGIFDSEREFWTVMELCAGGRLSDWLGRYANTAKTIVQQLLEAVCHLHAQLVCHLDIKPDNVLLSGSGEVRLCDFVTACQLQQADQQLSGKCGTVGFRAPEVESGGAYSGLKADVYSLGRTLQIQELGAVRIGWPELEEILPYMTKHESLDRPEMKMIQEHLTTGSQGRQQLDWSSLESISYQQVLAESSLEPRVMVGKAAPPKERDSVQRPRAAGLRAAEAGPAMKACHSSYCRRLGTCICNDRVPATSASMKPQDRKMASGRMTKETSSHERGFRPAMLTVKSPSDFEERHGQHGPLRFAGGRSLQVTPHSSVAVGQLKAALALESGIRMLFLTEAAVYLVHEVLHVLDSIGLGRHEVMSHLDAAALAFQEESPEDDVEVWQQFEVSEMPPERLKTFLLRGSRPEFVQTTFTVYEPGGPDEARREGVAICDIWMIHTSLRPVALRANRSCAQVIDRWFMQLGGVVLVNATQRSEFLEHVASLEFALGEVELLRGVRPARSEGSIARLHIANKASADSRLPSQPNATSIDVVPAETPRVKKRKRKIAAKVGTKHE